MSKPAKKIVFWILILIAPVIPAMLFYNNTKATVIEQAGKEAKAIAYVIAASLASDAADYRVLYENAEKGVDGVDQAIYQRFLSEFHALRVNTGASYIFTEKKLSESKVIYILDGEPQDSENFSPIGSEDELGPTEQAVFETGEPKATGLIVDPNWGTFVTGLALIKDKQTGESLGLVGVDFSAADVSKMLQTLRSALYYVNIIVALA